MNRILVIRGGAIGDFILTLPALKAIRDAYPASRMEIVGYEHTAGIADKRFYADAIRSIEFGPLSSFFARNAELPDDLCRYFSDFDVIISYLYDPDHIFESNLRRCGVENIVIGPHKISQSEHAARQLAHPVVDELGIKVVDWSPRLFPSVADREAANEFLRALPRPIVAIHPGSGSKQKNWPLGNWIELINRLLGPAGFEGSLLVVSGESDGPEARALEFLRTNQRVAFAKNLKLPLLAAVLEQTTFIGHDSGISHLAAAAGARCVLLFGPTDPAIWAPLNEATRIIRPPNEKMDTIAAAEVLEGLQSVGVLS